METTFSSSNSSWGGYQMFNLSYPYLDMKVASILAELYLGEKDSMSCFYFYDHDFENIPPGKVLRIRLDVVDESKLFKKNKKGNGKPCQKK